MKNIIKELNNSSDNHVYSPAVLYYALLLLSQITNGETKEEILNVLKVEDKDVLSISNNLYNKLNFTFLKEVMQMNSSLWLNKDNSFKEETIKKIASDNNTMIQAGEMGSLEFDRQIQGWINRNTRNLLKDSVSNIKTRKEEIVELISAIYLKTSWLNGFENEDTKIKNFYVSDKVKEKCEFMNKKSFSDFLYSGEHFKAIKMLLNNDGYMLFILPNKGYELKDIQNDLDLIECLSGNIDKLKKEIFDIKVSIPKFDIKTDSNITEEISKLGIHKVLDRNKADFSSISDEEIYLSNAIQASRLKIDENGVEAASYVTMVMVMGACMPEEEKCIDFIVDRPFMFNVVCNDIPVFIGTVVNPNKD